MLSGKYPIVKGGCWAKTPPFSEGSWERYSPRTSKTVRGTRAKRRVPRTVFEVRGLHLSQRSRGKGGVLSLYPGYAGLPLEQGFSENVASWARCITLRKTVLPRCHVFWSVMYLGQDATFSEPILGKMLSSRKEQNRQNRGIMLSISTYPYNFFVLLRPPTEDSYFWLTASSKNGSRS